MPHRTRIGDDGDRLMKLNVDFLFLGPRDTAGETIPVLLIREEKTRMTLSSAVPSKTTGEIVARRVLAFLSEIGYVYKDVIIKSDQEPALISLVEDVERRRAAVGGGRWICENSPVGSSASNGVAERAIIQSVQHQVRVLKLALEYKWNMSIPHKHSVLPWIKEYSAFLLNRFEMGHDGKTAYERLKGKKAKVLGIAFGEMVNWRTKPTTGLLGKLDSMWDDGVYLGVRGKSGELIVGNRSGVWKTRTLRRKPSEDRWTQRAAELVVGVPWRTSDDDPKIDGERREVTVLEPVEKELLRSGGRDLCRAMSTSPKRISKHMGTLVGALGVVPF